MAPPAAQTALPALPPTAAMDTRAQIMVVDDSRATREVLKLILGTEFGVVECEGGLSAWERLESATAVKALITDIEMPGIDGIELINRIRKSENPRIRDLPVIAITGADDQETRRRAFISGATGFIIKPIDTVQLQALLHAYVHHDEVKRELEQKSVALEEQSVTDALTGLRSRRYFMDRGEQDVAFAIRREKELTLIRIDIDKFQEIRQNHPKERVDALLTWVAGILLDNARVEDTVARMGDAEFAFLAMATDLKAARVVCDRLRNAITVRPFNDANISIPVTLNMGIADLEEDHASSMQALLTLAQERFMQSPYASENRSTRNDITTEISRDETPAPVLTPTHKPPKPVVVDPIEALSVEELEQLIRQEVPTKAPSTVSDVGDPAVDVPAELVSVETALQLIAQNKGELLHPYLDQLIQQLRPLLEYHRIHRSRS